MSRKVLLTRPVMRPRPSRVAPYRFRVAFVTANCRTIHKLATSYPEAERIVLQAMEFGISCPMDDTNNPQIGFIFPAGIRVATITPLARAASTPCAGGVE